MFTYQLKKQVTEKLNEKLRVAPIGRLRSGNDVQFFLISAITEVQSGRERIVDFGQPEFEKMIAYNRQQIAKTTDTNDITALTALNEVLAEIGNIQKPKKAAEAKNNDSVTPAAKPPQPPKQPPSGSHVANVSGKTISLENLDTSTLREAWDAVNQAASMLELEGGFIEHYTKKDFDAAIKLPSPQFRKLLSKLDIPAAGSGNAQALYNTMDTLIAVHEELTQHAPINDNRETALERLEASKATQRTR